jgi:RNA recognition motif-containing protein
MDIYVGNLAYKTTDDDLRDLFSAHGEVTSARVVMDRISGQSKGFGFVEMPDRDGAQKAIEAINGQDFQGRGGFRGGDRGDRGGRGGDRGGRSERW